MKLSIITICYNDKAGFEKTAKSVIAQTWKDFEWIIVDGASTDGTVDSIKEAVSQLSSLSSQFQVHWKSEPDKGIYNAMNKGIRQAQGEYCLFLNSGDCFCSPKSLQRVMRDVCDSNIVACDIFIDRKTSRIYDLGFSPDRVTYQRFFNGCLYHQSTFINTELCRKFEYDEHYRIISDLVFWFETIIRNNATYKHISVPITIFDSTGVGSCKSDIHLNELNEYFSHYFTNGLYKRLLQESSYEGSINALYLNSFSKKLMILVCRFIYSVQVRVVNPLIKLYKNIKYISKL